MNLEDAKKIYKGKFPAREGCKVCDGHGVYPNPSNDEVFMPCPCTLFEEPAQALEALMAANARLETFREERELKELQGAEEKLKALFQGIAKADRDRREKKSGESA